MQNDNIFDLGLSSDLNMLMRSPISRRRALRLGAVGLTALLAGCRVASTAPAANTSSSNATSNSASSNACLINIPGETAGPYPGDGSRASNQTLNALTRSGIVRADIRTSTTSKNVAVGVPLAIELTLVDTNKSCAPLTDYAIYIWHCTRDGLYSMYSNGVIEEVPAWRAGHRQHRQSHVHHSLSWLLFRSLATCAFRNLCRAGQSHCIGQRRAHLAAGATRRCLHVSLCCRRRVFQQHQQSKANHPSERQRL